MKTRQRGNFLAGVLVVVSLMGTATSSARAADLPQSTANASETLAAQAKEADARGYMILSPAQAEVVGDAIFYPTGLVSDRTLVVVANADGSLPNGLTTEKLDHAAQLEKASALDRRSTESSNDNSVSPLAATSYAWSASSSGYSQSFQGGSAVGWDDNATVNYYFYTNPGYNQRASGEGLGFYRGYNGSQFGTWQKYYYVGTGGSTGAGSSVPWGNTAATKYFRAICTQTTYCGGYFQ